MRRFVAAALAVISVAALLSVGTEPARASTVAMPYDFDGDGHRDLVAGVPSMRIHDHGNAGAVVVLPASAAGLSLHEMLISQSSPGVPGASEDFDAFGFSVASADFDRDGYADLAIGAPEESVGGREAAGSVTVVYGSARGLETSRSMWIGRPGGSVQHVNWGASLVAGDFNGDGYPDLAVGAILDYLPGMNSTIDVGTVRVLSGSAGGLRDTGVPVLGPQGGTSEAHTWFGYRLAAGDLDGDGLTDIVVGAQGENLQEAGYKDSSVSYCPGKIGGPTTCRRLAVVGDYSGLQDLAVGNMSGDARPEIALGLPRLVGDAGGGGRVQVLQLSTGPSITVTHLTTITQNSAGVPGVDEDDDFFGFRIALGDLDKDGYGDLVVGAIGENERSGRVTVVHGDSTGWRTSGNCAYSQNTRGVPGVAERNDSFGWALTLLDHDGDGYLDLTVGAIGENEGDGAITTLRGSPGCGFTADGSRTFGLGTLGYTNKWRAETGNWSFGSTLGQP